MRAPPARRRRGVMCLALPLGLVGSPAVPQTQVVLGAEARTQYSTNPLLLPGGKTEAAMAELSLKPEIKIQNATGDSFDLAGVVTGRRYSRRYDDYLLGSLDATGRLRDSERLSAQLTGGYVRDIVADTLASSADALLAPQAIRNNWHADADIIWRPNGHTTVEPRISAERSTYENNPLLRTTKSADAELSLMHLLSPETWVGLKPLAAYSKTAGQPGLLRLALFAQADKRLPKGWHLKAQAGAEHIDGAPAHGSFAYDRKARTFFSGSLEICRTGERNEGCFVATLGSEVSALLGFQRRTAISLRVSRHMSEHVTVHARADYQRISAPARLVGETSLHSTMANAGIDWRLSPSATLSADVNYARRTYDVARAPHAITGELRLRWAPRVR